jgi:hypothetical protein
MPAPNSDDFRKELSAQLRRAKTRGAAEVEINAGELHRAVGEYPSGEHRMPSCCEVMRAAMRSGDEVISEPPKGKGASLTIRYRL